MTSSARYAIRQPARHKGGTGRPQSEDRSGPTPETRAKHVPDPLDLWDGEYKRNGLEIARVRSALVGSLTIRAQHYEERSKSHGDPLGKITDRRLKLFRDWCLFLGSYQQVVLEVICDMTAPYIIDQRLGKAPGTVGQWTKVALDEYAKMKSRYRVE